MNAEIHWGEPKTSATEKTHGLLYAGDQIDDGEWEREVHITLEKHTLSDGKIRWSFRCELAGASWVSAGSGLFSTEDAARRAAETVARGLMALSDDLEEDG